MYVCKYLQRSSKVLSSQDLPFKDLSKIFQRALERISQKSSSFRIFNNDFKELVRSCDHAEISHRNCNDI